MKAALGRIILYVLVRISVINGAEVVININNGAIRGQEAIDEHGNGYYDFRGIPYAEAPVGNFRFKSPVSKLPWDGSILNTTQDGPACPQISFFSHQFVGAEDNCLTLNVYTPKLPSNHERLKLDVVFHIHGGGFALGAGGSFYHPGRFMQQDKNAILVSLTYRVASLGFLSTSDEESPGNYGLLDQVEALRWVRNNIHHFGGDPTKVTILGESAGGASVIYHMLSPLSKGLFQRAIAMSGTALCPWAFQTDPIYWLKFLGHRVNCPETNAKELFNCLKTKLAKELIENDGSFDAGFLTLHLTPTLDHHFILDTPQNLLRKKQYNDVPLLIGVTKDEGNTWFRFGQADPHADFSDERIESYLTTLFSSVTNVDKAVKKIKETYLSDLKTRESKEVYRYLGQIVTDSMFHKNHYQTIKMLVDRKSTVFAYSYDYYGNSEERNKLFRVDSGEELGAFHASDLANFFGDPEMIKSKPVNTKDLFVKEKMQKLFFNFIRTGNPNSEDVEVKWPQATSDQLNVYHINTESEVSVYDSKADDTYKFWVEEIPKILGETDSRSSARNEL